MENYWERPPFDKENLRPGGKKGIAPAARFGYNGPVFREIIL